MSQIQKRDGLKLSESRSPTSISVKYNRWNYDRIRPAGARLKTMGGRASGPGPLNRSHGILLNALSEGQLDESLLH